MPRWKKENPGKSALGMRGWLNTEKGKLYAEQHKEYMKEYRRKKGKDVREKQRNYYAEARLEALVHYGGNPPKCAICGESRLPCLSLDHINNDGSEHRRQMEKEYGYKLGGNQILMWLRKNNYPSGILQVLCYNCNIVKEMEKRKNSLSQTN
jgi:hypothetical protein